MTINPLTGIISGASSQLQRTAQRVQSTIDSLVTGNRVTQASEDVASLAVAAQLQSRIGSLRQVSGNIAQAVSLTQVAAGGVGRQQEIVERLRTLSVQANSGALNDASRKALNSEFQSLVGELNRLATNTQFNGQNLLDGSFRLSVEQSLGQEETPDGAVLALPDLTAQALFSDGVPDLTTQENAAKAFEALGGVSKVLSQAQADIGGFAGALGYASANLESALFNQQAAFSTLSDADFGEQATLLAQLNTQNQAQIALAAQGNKLLPNILQLLQ